MFVVCCLLHVVRSLWFVVVRVGICCLLCVVCIWLCIVCCVLFVVCRVACDACSLLFVCWLLVVVVRVVVW